MVSYPRLGTAVAALLGAGALSLVAACSGGGSPANRAGGSPTSSSASVPSTASADASGAAVAAYEAMWQDQVNAFATADYRNPHLGDHATGQALTTNTAVLRYDHDHGIVGRGRPVLHPTATALAASTDEVQISDCMDATHWLEYRASGGLADNTPGGKHRVSATVSRTSGVWRVSQLVIGGVGSC